MRKVGVYYTITHIVEDVKKQFEKQLPEVEMINIVDGGLQEEIVSKGITPGVIGRISDHCRYFEQIGCEAILNTCSASSVAMAVAKKMVSIPVLNVDYPMAKKAVELGSKIAVIKTEYVSPEPSRLTVENTARELGKEVAVELIVCKDVLDAWKLDNDKAKFDRSIIEVVKKAAERNDVVIMAQVSMYHWMKLFGEVNKPVLNSLESGVAQIRETLGI